MLITGFSHVEGIDTLTNVQQLINDCKKQMAAYEPQAGIVFATAEFDLVLMLDEINKNFQDINLVGCTTEGIFSSEIDFTEYSMSLVLFYSDEVKITTKIIKNISEDFGTTFENICSQIPQQETKDLSLCLSFPDSNSPFLNSVIEILGVHLGSDCPIFGIGSNNPINSEFKPRQFFKNEVLEDSLPLLFFEGPIRYSFNLNNLKDNLNFISNKEISGSVGQNLTHVGDLTAFEFIKKNLGIQMVHMDEFSMAVYENKSNDFYLRCLKSWDENSGIIKFFHDVSENASLQIVQIDKGKLINNFEKFTKECFAGFESNKHGFAMIFSCFHHNKFMFHQENKIFENLKEIPYIGTCSLGLISPFKNKYPSKLHNSTMLALVIDSETNFSEQRKKKSDATKTKKQLTLYNDLLKKKLKRSEYLRRELADRNDQSFQILKETSTTLEDLKEDNNRLKHILKIVYEKLESPLDETVEFSNNITKVKDEQQEWAQLVNESGEQILYMIEHSLDTFKMEEGTYELHPGPCDLVKMFRGINEDLGTLIEKKSITMNYTLLEEELEWEDSYWISGEEHQLVNMFSNLIKNAIEASPENKKVSISINEDKKNHSIIIHNFGIVPESLRDHFFERYSTGGKKGGTGLGTYSALLIAKIHKGNIKFTSSEEEGTSLIVVLPNIHVEPIIEKEDSKTEQHSKIFSDLKVLLAEDNLINQQIAEEFLQNFGISVEIANNGLQAVEIISKDSFDLVLMDMEMPEMDGFEATACIRKNPQFENLPIIAMTAHSIEETKDEFYEAGINDYIAKPIDAQNLFSTLKKWLRRDISDISEDNGRGDENLEYKRPDIKPEIEPPLFDNDHEVGDDVPDDQVINIESALKMVWGKKKLLEKTMKNFLEKHSNSHIEIRTAYNNNDLKNGVRIAHTIKGLAKYFTSKNLIKSSEKLEKAFYKGEFTDIEELIQNFENDLSPVVDYINNLLAEGDFFADNVFPEEVQKDIDIPQQLKQLSRLLKDYDSEAKDILEDLKYHINPIIDTSQDLSELWKGIGKQLDLYEFDQASSNLKKFMEKMELRFRQ